jgi:hypothetical protein
MVMEEVFLDLFVGGFPPFAVVQFCMDGLPHFID